MSGRRTNLATAIPNCSDFVIKKEDHTIGNLVSEHAKLHRNVLMAGYKSMLSPLCLSTTPRKLTTDSASP